MRGCVCVLVSVPMCVSVALALGCQGHYILSYSAAFQLTPPPISQTQYNIDSLDNIVFPKFF